MNIYIKKIRIRIQKIFASKRGLTLVEVIVGCVLFALIAVTAASVLSPMLKAYTRANEIAEFNLLLDSVGNRIISDMKQASEVQDYDEDTVTMMINSSTVVYEVVDGVLQRNDNIVFPMDYYKGKNVSFTIAPTSSDTGFLINVTVSSNNTGVEISRSYAVRPLLME